MLSVVCSAFGREGGEGVESCVFVVTQKHINFGSDIPRSATSSEPCPGNTGITHLPMNVGRRDAHGEGGVLTRWKGGEGHFLVAMEKRENIMASCIMKHTIFR